MRVVVARSGGFAGLARTWQADAPELAALVADCPWDAVPPPPAGADRFQYHVHAQGRTADVTEPLPAPWKRLIDKVIQLNGPA